MQSDVSIWCPTRNTVYICFHFIAFRVCCFHRADIKSHLQFVCKSHMKSHTKSHTWYTLCLFPFRLLSVSAPFRFSEKLILPLSVSAPFRLWHLFYATFRFGKYLILPNYFMLLYFMPLSFMPLSVSAPFRFGPFPFMPVSGLMEMANYAGFLYASFRRPTLSSCHALFLIIRVTRYHLASSSSDRPCVII
jgi:hypothetical protein